MAAQQRAEAAYRRQRVAQERAEESAIWRAEMEVERARMLKEMSGEGSRRLSYCQDVDELRKAAPDECNVCLQKSITRSLDLSHSLLSRKACRCTLSFDKRHVKSKRKPLVSHFRVSVCAFLGN